MEYDSFEEHDKIPFFHVKQVYWVYVEKPLWVFDYITFT